MTDNPTDPVPLERLRAFLIHRRILTPAELVPRRDPVVIAGPDGAPWPCLRLRGDAAERRSVEWRQKGGER